MKPFWQGLLRPLFYFLFGSIILCGLSIFQKIYIGVSPFKVQGYVLPFLFGGIVSLLSFWLKEKVQIQEKAISEKDIKINRVLEHFSMLFDSLPYPLEQINRDGIIIDCNKKSQELYGRKKHEIVGNNLKEFFHEEQYKKIIADLKKIKMGQQVQTEVQVDIGDSHFCEILRTETLIHDSNTNEEQILCISIDVTSYNQLKNEISHHRKMEAVGQLASSIAHDFNNILSIVFNATQALKRRIPEDEKTKKYFEVIQRSVERATKITGKLLLFSRKEFATKKRIDVCQIINDAKFILEQSIGKTIKIETLYEKESLYVSGNEAELQNVFINLGVNAVQAMPEGGSLSFIVKSEHDLVKIEVRDTGHGINQENLKKIFDPFFSTKEKGRGTGLGLSTVYAIVKAAKGDVQVESKVGAGTSFYISLPTV